MLYQLYNMLEINVNLFGYISFRAIFAFIFSSVSSFQGYYTSGGALEVGKSSTNAVTNSCIAILIADYILAQILL